MKNGNSRFPKLQKKEIRQFDSGMCYAHRDSKAMEFFNKSIGLDIIEPSVLELATTFHRKLFYIKQILSKYQGVNYSRSESILDWGRACESINNILSNGICEKSVYSSSSFHLIYNVIRNLPGVSLEICDDCKPDLLGLNNQNKSFFQKLTSLLRKKRSQRIKI